MNNDFSITQKLTEIYKENEKFEKEIRDSLNLDDIINHCDIYLSSLNENNKENNKEFTPGKLGDTPSNSITNSEQKNRISFSNQNLIDNNELERIIKEAESLITKDDFINHENLEMADLFPNLSEKQEPIVINQENVIKPIIFVNLNENQNYRNSPLLNFNDNIFILEQIQSGNKLNYEFIKFYTKEKLFNRITRNNIVTCIFASKNVIFTGSKNGVIKTFSCDKENEYKTFTCREIQDFSEDKDVMCITCSPSTDVFASGYENGFIILWDVASTKPRKIINDKQSSPIIELKFLKCENKAYTLLSSDLNGEVTHIYISEGFIRTNVTKTVIKKLEIPHFLIECLNFSDEEKEHYNIKNELKTIKNSIFVVGNIESIEIFLEDKGEYKSVGKSIISNPSTTNEIPDACFGYGYTSYHSLNSNNSSQMTSYCSSHAVDYSKPQILLAISWGLKIDVYIVPLIDNVLQEPELVGNYINNSPFIRMGFLSSSILFFFDKNKVIKCINTSELSIEDMVQVNTLRNKKRSDSLSNERQVVEPMIVCQSIVSNPSRMEQINIYYNCIVTSPQNIFFMGQDKFHHAQLLSWEKCLKELQEKFCWNELFCLGIDIYKGRVTGLADIPMNPEHRKQRVQYVLKEYAKQFVNIQLDNNLKKEKDYINVVIEFCIKIDAVDFLLNEIYEIFDSRHLSDAFFNKLEPFILRDKMKASALNNSTLMSLIKVYSEQNKCYLLSQLLSHLDINSLKNHDSFITTQFKQYNMINGMIYYYMNGKEEFFSPVLKMFEEFLKANNIVDIKNRNEFPGNFYSNNTMKKVSHEIFENSKEYLGHKLFWYINLCLDEKKWPDTEITIKDHKFSTFLVEVFLWLISDKVLTSLVTFDSYTYFYILTKFFTENKIYKRILKISQEIFDSKIKEYNLQYIPSNSCISVINGPDLIQIVNYIVEICEEFHHIYINLDLYEFIVKISTRLDLEMNLMLRAADFILKFDKTYNEKIGNENEIYDKFNCHIELINFKINSKFVTDLNDNIIEMIDIMNLKDEEENDKEINTNMTPTSNVNKRDFANRCLPILVASSEMSLFVYVKVHLLKLNKDYFRCIDTLIKAQKVILLPPEDGNNVFNFINTILTQLENDEEIEEFEKVKDYVLEKLPHLAELSIDQVSKLVEDWFKDCHDEVIHKLDNVKSLQLQFIEKEIDKKNKDIEQNQNVDNSNLTEEIGNLLFMQVDLLIKLNKSKLILPVLIERKNNFPIQQCLDICLENGITDASIFILMKIKKNKRALEIALIEIGKVYENMRRNLVNGPFNQNNHEIYIEDLKKGIEQCEAICENVESDDLEIEDLWFSLLTELYKILKQFKSIKTDNHQESLKEIEDSLSFQIEQILKQMCCYISINKVIDQVTENFKDAEFKEFKLLLVKMLSSFSHMNIVLTSAKQLLGNSVRCGVKEYTKIKNKGEVYKLDKCDVCQKGFSYEKRERIFVFPCGHKEHEKCVVEISGNLVCQKCRKNDIELFNFGRENLQPKRHRPSIDILASERQDKTDDDLFAKAKRKHVLERLRIYDKKYIEKSDFI